MLVETSNDSELKTSLDQLLYKKNCVEHALNRLQDKSRSKSGECEKMLVLNNAAKIINRMERRGQNEYDLVHELQEDEAEQQASGCYREPLYRKEYPKWDIRVRPDFLR
jgi:hypothetical protein